MLTAGGRIDIGAFELQPILWFCSAITTRTEPSTRPITVCGAIRWNRPAPRCRTIPRPVRRRSDFLYWRAHFGETMGAGSGEGQASISSESQAVTAEPSSPPTDELPVSEPLTSSIAVAIAPTPPPQSSNIVAEVSIDPSQQVVALLGSSPRPSSLRSNDAGAHVHRSAASDGAAESVRGRALLAFLVDRPGKGRPTNAHEADMWADVEGHKDELNTECLSQAASVDAFFGQSLENQFRHGV